MQNNYIKQLAIKSYQEDLAKAYYQTRDQRFHTPSFVVGILVSVIFWQIGWPSTYETEAPTSKALDLAKNQNLCAESMI